MGGSGKAIEHAEYSFVPAFGVYSIGDGDMGVTEHRTNPAAMFSDREGIVNSLEHQMIVRTFPNPMFVMQPFPSGKLI